MRSFVATTAQVTIHPLHLTRLHRPLLARRRRATAAAATPVLALAVALVSAFALGVILTPPAIAETVHGVPLPRGSRVADPARPADNLFVSGRGFRDTVEHVRRHLARTGIPHQAIAVYRRGPVTLARFISRQPGLPWLAIHVFQQTGKTFIAIIPAPATPPAVPAPAPPPAGAPPS